MTIDPIILLCFIKCALLFSRLHERLQECNGDEVLKAEAGAKVQKFTEWALKCIGFHSRCQGNKDRVNQNSAVQVQLQLSAFKTFLDLAGNHLTGKDFTEAFDAACFPLTLFSSSFDPGWASGMSATAVQGLLAMLVEGGADNVNQCFLEASRFGSTELVRILLQVTRKSYMCDAKVIMTAYCYLDGIMGGLGRFYKDENGSGWTHFLNFTNS